MAGLQYYFFPTDFYYPRPKPTPDANGRDSCRTIQNDSLVHVRDQPQNEDHVRNKKEDEEQTCGNNKFIVRVTPTTRPLVITTSPSKEQRRFEPIVAGSRKAF